MLDIIDQQLFGSYFSDDYIQGSFEKMIYKNGSTYFAIGLKIFI